MSVENITPRGVWLFAAGAEYFLDYRRFPWFKDAAIRDIQNVKLVRCSYLQWPALDVDLELDCLSHPDRYPLVYR